MTHIANICKLNVTAICFLGRVDHLMTLVRRGCSPNEESPKGLTPLLCLILCGSPSELIEELLALKADINAVNKFGMSALMLACRIKSVKVVHMLLRGLASSCQESSPLHGMVVMMMMMIMMIMMIMIMIIILSITGSKTALHWCLSHGSEEEAKLLTDYVKDSQGDGLRVGRLLDVLNGNRESPLMIAAR
jgi:ankyrin repeat protein